MLGIVFEKEKNMGRIKDKGKKISEILGKHFAAITYAEQGEYEIAREFIKQKKKGEVLLIIEGEDVNQAVIDYALDIVKQNYSHLRILIIFDSIKNEQKNDYLLKKVEKIPQTLKSIIHKLTKLKIRSSISFEIGDPFETIFCFIKAHKDIVLCIYDSPRLYDKSGASTKKQQILKELSTKTSIPFFALTKRN